MTSSRAVEPDRQVLVRDARDRGRHDEPPSAAANAVSRTGPESSTRQAESRRTAGSR